MQFSPACPVAAGPQRGSFCGRPRKPPASASPRYGGGSAAHIGIRAAAASWTFKPPAGVHRHGISGEWRDDLRGTPQGSVISPILANVYLHYVLDLWFQKKWRNREANGDTVIVRYADDCAPRRREEEVLMT